MLNKYAIVVCDNEWVYCGMVRQYTIEGNHFFVVLENARRLQGREDEPDFVAAGNLEGMYMSKHIAEVYIARATHMFECTAKAAQFLNSPE